MQPQILNSEATMTVPEEALDDRDRLITQLREQLQKEQHNHKILKLEIQNLQVRLDKEKEFYEKELGKFQRKILYLFENSLS